MINPNTFILGFRPSHQFGNDSKTALDYKTAPEWNISTMTLVDTGAIGNADSMDLIDPEIALVMGPSALISEFIWVDTDSKNTANEKQNNPNFYGYYITGSYFLTGEQRKYVTDQGGGNLGQIKPASNFDLKGGSGAWELAVRYSYIDLNDKGIKGGREGNWTAGVNWYLNPDLKWAFDYTRMEIKDRDSSSIKIDDEYANAWQTQFQFSF